MCQYIYALLVCVRIQAEHKGLLCLYVSLQIEARKYCLLLCPNYLDFLYPIMKLVT